MPPDVGSISGSDPLAYFLTWTTYGTWLPGDERGWIAKPGQFQPPNLRLQTGALARLKEAPCLLTPEERTLVENTIGRHCTIRSWTLHVVNCRTNHVHVVVTAAVSPKTVHDQFKAWCTRELKANQRTFLSDPSLPVRLNWWTEGGSKRYLNDEESLARTIHYVRDGQ